MRPRDTFGPTFPLSIAAKAEGVSESQFRRIVHGAPYGRPLDRVLIGDQVLPLTQAYADRLATAMGLDPYPERLADELEAAEAERRQSSARAKGDEAARAAYKQMCKARGDNAEEHIFR